MRKAEELVASDARYYMPNQFANPDNPRIHYESTARELWRQMGGDVDCFLAGVGSGGTLQGVGRFLKEHKPGVKLVAVEPKNVSALLGHEPGLHQIQGIGDGFIPPVLDVSLVDEVIEVTDEDAIETTRQLGRDHGLLVGISSGAMVWAARQLRKRWAGTITTVLPDRAERYFSTALLWPASRLLELVVPVELHDGRGDDDHAEDPGRPRPVAQHEVDGQRREAQLPDDADRYVGHVAAEVRGWAGSSGLPASPSRGSAPRNPTDGRSVELLQDRVVLRLAEQGAEQAADDREREDDGERVERIDGVAEDLLGQVGHDHRAHDAGHHAPEIAVAVEAPPVPLEHVGHDVAAVERADDPHHDVGDARGQQAEERCPTRSTPSDAIRLRRTSVRPDDVGLMKRL